MIRSNRYFEFMESTPGSELFVCYTSTQIENFLNFICMCLYNFQISPEEFCKAFNAELCEHYNALREYIGKTIF